MSRPLAFFLLLAVVGVMAIGMGGAALSTLGSAMVSFAQLGRAI